MTVQALVMRRSNNQTNSISFSNLIDVPPVSRTKVLTTSATSVIGATMEHRLAIQTLPKSCQRCLFLQLPGGRFPPGKAPQVSPDIAVEIVSQGNTIAQRGKQSRWAMLFRGLTPTAIYLPPAGLKAYCVREPKLDAP